MPERHSVKAKYVHHRQEPPEHFLKETLRTVPLSHSDYKGKKLKVRGAIAIVGTVKPAYRKNKLKTGTQSILTPKK